ncbi:MAG: hypothetical protein ACXVAM_00865 [Vulcanimicrobiaceae bacterium]
MFCSVDPHSDGIPAPSSEGEGTPPAGCSVRNTSYESWIGPHSARVIFDLGGEHLTPCGVAWALRTARSLRSALPTQREQDDGASVSFELPPATYNFVAPSITGAIERNYGWLTVSD